MDKMKIIKRKVALTIDRRENHRRLYEVRDQIALLLVKNNLNLLHEFEGRLLI